MPEKICEGTTSILVTINAILKATPFFSSADTDSVCSNALL